jgi:hypothetical protein
MAQHHLVVYVPVSHANAVRDALAKAGAGKMGDYTHCSFSMRGIGRFMPQQGANPAIGEVGKLEQVEEEKIEVILSSEIKLHEIVHAIKQVHPYEEPSIIIVPVADVSEI